MFGEFSILHAVDFRDGEATIPGVAYHAHIQDDVVAIGETRVMSACKFGWWARTHSRNFRSLAYPSSTKTLCCRKSAEMNFIAASGFLIVESSSVEADRDLFVRLQR
jgi:hypothetical protein